MKNLLIVLLVLSVSVQLCSCRSQPYNTLPGNAETQESSGTTSSTDAEVNANISQKPMYSIMISNIEDTHKADDGTTLLITKHQNISLVLPEQEVADAIILDFLERMDQALQSGESMLDAARSTYKTAENWAPFLLDSHFGTMRIDPSVLSLFGQKASYTGGAHGSYSGHSVTYDLLTGDVLRLPDILTPEVAGETIYKLIIESLEKSFDEHRPQLFPSYKDTLKQLFGENFTDLHNWYLSGDGLNFFFDPYVIGPFSEGIIFIEIPYDQLTGILRDAYFPAEGDEIASSINATYFSDANLEKFSQISEVIHQNDADRLLLYTDGLIPELRITIGPKGTLLVDNAAPGSSVFTCYMLSPGDAVMIEADLATTSVLLGYPTPAKYVSTSVIVDNDNLIIP